MDRKDVTQAQEYENRIATLEAELAEARRDGERLSHIIEQSNSGRGWLEDDVWDQAADLWYQQDDEEDVQKWVRAVIDKDIAAWGGAK